MQVTYSVPQSQRSPSADSSPPAHSDSSLRPRVHDSNFAIVSLCRVAGDFTVTVNRVAGPGSVSINPHRLDSATPSATAS